MRTNIVFRFWAPLLTAGLILSGTAIGTGASARVLSADWARSLYSACLNHRDQCLSLTIENDDAGILWDTKIVTVISPAGDGDFVVALLQQQMSPLQRVLVNIRVQAAGQGHKKGDKPGVQHEN